MGYVWFITPLVSAQVFLLLWFEKSVKTKVFRFGGLDLIFCSIEFILFIVAIDFDSTDPLDSFLEIIFSYKDSTMQNCE